MELVVSKKDLLRLVARCQGVADKKAAMPALSNVLLTAEGTTLHVAATDMYLSLSGSTGAEVVSAGSIAVPARDLPDDRTLDRTRIMLRGSVQGWGAERRYETPARGWGSWRSAWRW